MPAARSIAFASALAAGLLAGCQGDGLVPIHGTVTFAGQPVPAGVVWFDPDAGNPAAQGYALIKDGRFVTADAGGRGIKPGAYVVRVEGYDGKPAGEFPMGKPIFRDHQEKRTFAAGEEVTIAVPEKKPKN
jgi:hypothetical protein